MIINILGDEYKVVYVNKRVGGRYNLDTKRITIGNINRAETLLHEIIEVILATLFYIDYDDSLGSYGRTMRMAHSPHAKIHNDEFSNFVTILWDTLKRNNLGRLFK